MDFSKKASRIFVGLLYIVMGVLILMYPGFFFYWVSIVFFVHGIFNIFRATLK